MTNDEPTFEVLGWSKTCQSANREATPVKSIGVTSLVAQNAPVFTTEAAKRHMQARK